LSQLILRECGVRNKGCKALAEMMMTPLSDTTTPILAITTLDLSKNDIDEEGLMALSEALGWKGCTLEDLDLSRCNINEHNKGVESLGDYYFPSLKSLFLNDTNLNANSAKKLAHALKLNTVIVTLSLRDNYGIGDEGAIAFAESLTTNRTLNESIEVFAATRKIAYFLKRKSEHSMPHFLALLDSESVDTQNSFMTSVAFPFALRNLDISSAFEMARGQPEVCETTHDKKHDTDSR
ncbi:hypothetical protein THAPSDRAFT_261803, partial [Thalassiosira pseudonana CCMP1335]